MRMASISLGSKRVSVLNLMLVLALFHLRRCFPLSLAFMAESMSITGYILPRVKAGGYVRNMNNIEVSADRQEAETQK